VNATVIAQFTDIKQATQAVDKLLKSCVSRENVRTSLLKPSTQHPAHPAASTREISLWTRSSCHGTPARNVKTSCAGIPGKMGDDERRSPSRPAGVLVAVDTPDYVSRAFTVSVFSRHGARIVESDARCLPDDGHRCYSNPAPAASPGGYRSGENAIPALCRA
jgi:hypothetical protein